MARKSLKKRPKAARRTGGHEVHEKAVAWKVGRKKTGTAFRDLLIERAQTEVAAIINKASDEVVATALAETDPFASLARTISESVFGNPGVTDDDRVMQAAWAEGARYKHELLKRAGGVYTSEQLATALKRTRQAIHEGRWRNRYFAIPTADGVVFPKLQVTKDGLLPGLKEFLAAFALPDPWTQLMVLLEPSDRLGGKSPLAALRAGDRDGAVSVAAAYGGHGA